MYYTVLVTVPDIKTGRKLAALAVRKKLAACVNIIPSVRSLYIWDGKLCDDRELLLVIKTSKGVFARLSQEIKNLHPYKVPEIIALPIARGDKNYLKWLGTNCR